MADPFIAPVQSNAPGVSGIGSIINGQDPSYLYSVMQANRQKMLADALTQQGISGIDYDHAGAISPLQGLAKMLQAYAGAKGASSANQTLADAQAQGNQRAMQGLAGLFGAPVTDPTAASRASMGQGAMTQPSTPGADGEMVNQGGVGPTVTNAQRMGQMLSGGTGTQGAAFGVPGLSPQQMTMAYLMDSGATMKAALDAKSLTNEQKNSRDSLLGAGTLAEFNAKGKTPDILNAQYMGKTPAQMLAASLGADAKAAEITREPGKMFTNPITGASGIVPSLPQGVNANGVNPQTGAIDSVTPVPGANPAVAATEAAKVGEGVGSRTNSDGTVSQGRIADLWPNATQQGGVLQQGNVQLSPAVLQAIKADAAQNGITSPVVNLNAPGGGVAYSQGQAPAPSRVSTGPSPALAANITKNVDVGSSILDEAGKASASSGQVLEGLDQIYNAAKNHPESFGPGAQGVAQFKAMISPYVPGVDLTGAKTDQDVIDKLVAQMAGGSRTDAELSNKLHALPTSAKTSDAVLDLVPLLKSAVIQGQVRTQVLQHAKDASGGDNTAIQSAANAFDLTSSPRVVVSGQNLAKLSNASGANVPGTPANKQLGEYVQMLKTQGVYDRVLKLNNMGAF